MFPALMMELQPVGTERLKEDDGQAKEEKTAVKKRHEGQDESPPKKLVDHPFLPSDQSVWIVNVDDCR